MPNNGNETANRYVDSGAGQIGVGPVQVASDQILDQADAYSNEILSQAGEFLDRDAGLWGTEYCTDETEYDPDIFGSEALAEKDNTRRGAAVPSFRKKFEDDHKRVQEPFGEIIPLDVPVSDPFPGETIPAEYLEYMKSIADSKQVPIDLVCLGFLGVLSTALQGKYIVDAGTGGWTEPINLYLMLIAPPSERKSPVLDLLTKPLNDYQKQVNETQSFLVEQSKSKLRILEGKRDEIEKKVKKELAPFDALADIQKQIAEFKLEKLVRLYTNNATPEAIISQMAEHNGKFSIIASEGGAFNILDGAYNDKTVIDFINNAYSGEPIFVDRKGRESEQILDPQLTCLFIVQPTVLDKMLANNLWREKGFLGRWCYAYPKSLVGSRTVLTKPVDEELQWDYASRIWGMLDDKNKNAVITMDADAKDLFHQYMKDIEKRLDPDNGDLAGVDGWGGKHAGRVLRIAGLLARAPELPSNPLGDPPPVIDGPLMHAAIQIGDYLTNQYLNIIGSDESRESIRLAKRALEVILESGQERFVPKDFRACRVLRNADTKKVALSVLEDHNYIREIDPKPGKKRHSYEVNSAARK